MIGITFGAVNSFIGIDLLQMLCEEQGFFLEIVDIIRGFGLNILKARMERRKNKLWARFIVEVDPIFVWDIRVQITTFKVACVFGIFFLIF